MYQSDVKMVVGHYKLFLDWLYSENNKKKPPIPFSKTNTTKVGQATGHYSMLSVDGVIFNEQNVTYLKHNLYIFTFI